jgi:carbamate kinase
VEVDAADPALTHPTKYIGPVYSEEQASALAAEKGWVFKADGRYFRRVVPSPQPKRIVESDAITALIQRDHLVICNGGGGVPVVENANGYHGIEAVIDKDLSAALLARQIEADALLILTDADAVYSTGANPPSARWHRSRRHCSETCSSTPARWGRKWPPAASLLKPATALPGLARWPMARRSSQARKAR